MSGALALSAGSASALSIPAPCARDAEGMYAGKIEGWNNGHVLTSYVWEERRAPDAAWKANAIMRLIDCRSGKFVLLSRAPGGDKYDLPKPQTAVLDRLQEGSTISLGKFERAMKRAGVATQRFRDTEETCTCKVYFPELRGNKTPYQRRPGS